LKGGQVPEKGGVEVLDESKNCVSLFIVGVVSSVFDSKAAACTFMGGSKTTMYRAFAGDFEIFQLV